MTVNDRKIDVYHRRQPEQTLLYTIVQAHFESWLLNYPTQHQEVLPYHVEYVIRKYLRCGILAHGFARARCSSCGHEFFIAFSCKTKGFCPSCNTRRMTEVAAYLIDHVLPKVNIRQWVFSLPKRIRYYLVRDPKLASDVLNMFIDEIKKQLQQISIADGTEAKLAAISFIQRFGSTLNQHLHYHCCIVDGLFYQDKDGLIRFHPMDHLGIEDIEMIVARLRKRILRLMKRRGLMTAREVEDMLSWPHSGFSVNADVSIDAGDRKGLERLIRYCARPPFSSERLQPVDDNRLRYELQKPDQHGRRCLFLSPMELLDKLCLLIPPPRKHCHRYHGVLAPNSPWRKAVVAYAGKPLPAALSTDDKGKIGSEPSDLVLTTSIKVKYTWAMLIARIYETMPLICVHCQGEVKVLSFITGAHEIKKILDHVGEPSEPPLLASARGPPQVDWVDSVGGVDIGVTYDTMPDNDFNQDISW